jgi:hypothetical protein
MSFFDASRPPRGAAILGIRLGDVGIRLEGLDDDVLGDLLERYAPFRDTDSVGADVLRVTVGAEPRDYFIEPPKRAEFNPVLLACDGERIRYMGYRAAGWFDTRGGSGTLLLSRGEFEPAWRSIENYIRAAVAWQASTLGGALIHAASAVWHEKGFLFYGESGAGKSTLSESNRRARVVSDDLSLVLPGTDGSPELVGSPFRGTYEGGGVVLGRFPLAAGFRIIKDQSASVREVSRARALAELVGNLPFVAESFSRRPDLFRSVERTFAGLPLAHLHFAKGDEGFWDAIANAGLAG